MTTESNITNKYNRDEQTLPIRAFQGYNQLAYLSDIIELQKRIVKWLTGSDDPFAITALIHGSGFVPLNSLKRIDNKYYGIQTQYNTNTIDDKTVTYNFLGKNVYLTQSQEYPNKVNIEIRQLKCASNLGKHNGLTDGNIYLSDNISGYAASGRLPKLETLAEQDLKLGDWQSEQIVNTFQYNSNRFDVETKDYITFASSGTFFVISLITPESTTSKTVQSELIVSGMMNPELKPILQNQNIILAGDNKNIIFSISDWQSDDGNTAKAKIKVSFNLNEIFKNQSYQKNIKPSRFKVSITHHNYDVATLKTYLNWDYWVTREPAIDKYVKENTFTCTTPDYFYITGKDLSYQNFSYSYENGKYFKTSNIQQIYNGNVKFTLTNIKNLYNLASVNSNIKITSNITEDIIISSKFTPEENIAAANLPISYEVTLPLKQNIYSNTLSTNIIIENAWEQKEFTEIQTLTTYVNTLSSNLSSTILQEYFYDNETQKQNNEKFGQKYRITNPEHEIDITQSDLQVIPGSGLYYTSGVQSYIRNFSNPNKDNQIKIQFDNLNIIDDLNFINNLNVAVSGIFEPLSTYIEDKYFKKDNLYILTKKIPEDQLYIAVYINENIATPKALICTAIKIKEGLTDIISKPSKLLNKLIIESSKLL